MPDVASYAAQKDACLDKQMNKKLKYTWHQTQKHKSTILTAMTRKRKNEIYKKNKKDDKITC